MGDDVFFSLTILTQLDFGFFFFVLVSLASAVAVCTHLRISLHACVVRKNQLFVCTFRLQEEVTHSISA